MPEPLRAEIAAYAQQRRAAGAGVEAIARETGVSGESLRRWMAGAPRRRRPAMVAVEIRPESGGAGVVVVNPGGYRVEGLDVVGGGRAAPASGVIGSTRNVVVWAYPAPADLRNGYDGLAGLVAATLRRDPLSGDCYVFTNRTRTRAKVLVWDGTGLCIYQKRLERGRFACLWERERGGAVTLTMSELALFLEGATVLARLPLSPARVTLGPVARGRGA